MPSLAIGYPDAIVTTPSLWRANNFFMLKTRKTALSLRYLRSTL
jgi:hypothetical protein